MERYGTARQNTDDDKIRRRPDAICMHSNKGKKYRHALRIFITNYFAMATMVMRTRLLLYTHTAGLVKLSYDKVTMSLWT